MPMPTRTRALRFTAVLSFVVLSLTGFSRGGHSSHGHSYGHSHGGGGGGGCSNSHQDHDTSSSSSSSSSGGSSYDDTDETGGDDYYGSSGTSTTGGTYRRPTHGTTPSASSGGGSALKDGKLRLISCANAKRPYATVELTNPNNRKATFTVDVSFRDRDDTEIDFNYKNVTVPAKGTVTAKVEYDSGYSPDLPDHCEIAPEATAVE
ncbi:hypothetical protein [Streptomyces sp. NPDC048106]|uniref:hypothetical protein n=1 Tax=Streptomyces sp. NPDC048106 TaxID=3155750 RepID=UPI0034542391